MGEKVEIINEEKNAAAAAAETEGGGKKDEPSTAVVLKLDLHCEGCAKKVRRSVSHLEGVVTVKADCDAKKLTVTGNVDPAWLREKVEAKTKKKVELLSPQPKPAAGDDKKAEEKKPQDSKEAKEAAAASVTMKTKLHCDGCAHKIKRIIIKNFDGVDLVTTDLQKDLITVVGKMDVTELITYLRGKLRRGVEIVPPKKHEAAAAAGWKNENENENDKEKEKGKGKGKGKEKEKEKERENAKDKELEKEKEKGSGGGGGDGGGGGGGEEKKGEEREGKAETKVEMSKMEHHSSYNPETHYAVAMVMHEGYGNVYDDQRYYMNAAAPPPLPPPTYVNMNDNMFSDENPNGCRVM